MSKKILVLSVNPKDAARLRLDEEVREISEGLKLSPNRDQFTLHQACAVRLRDLRRAMLEHEPQIVHFCGHGEENGLLVEDVNGQAVRVSSDALSGLFALFADQVECVLLNACYSENQAEAINKHIDYVIGMSEGIQDEIAIEFAVGFYDTLGAGKSIEEAFKFGRNAIELYGLPHHLVPRLLIKKKETIEIREPYEQHEDGINKFYYDCQDRRFINDLKNADQVCIIGVLNENLRHYLMEAFRKRRDERGEKKFRWEKITVVFLARNLLKYLDDTFNQNTTVSIEDKWDEAVYITRFTLRIVAEKEDIRVYDKFFPFVGQQFDDNHVRVTYVFPGSEMGRRCYTNIVGDVTPCRFVDGNPQILLCTGVCGAGNTQSTSSILKNTFMEIVKSSKSILNANVSGNYKQENGNYDFYFEQLLPQTEWSIIQFPKEYKDYRIPVYIVVLVLITNQGKIFLHKRTDETAGTVKGKYAVISGKVQDEDFFYESERDSEYYTQLDLFNRSFDERKNSKLKFRVFVRNMNNLSQKFAKNVNINIGDKLPPDVFQKVCKRAVERAVSEKLGLGRFDKLGISFEPFNMKKYPLEQYLEIPHSDEETNDNAKYHRIITQLYTCELSAVQLNRIWEKTSRANFEEFTLDAFKDLYEKNQGKSYTECELTPFIMKNYESIYNYVENYQKEM
ncbi:MAG: CHAT domain-containing protein [Candidatus Hodarchaeota archaeon]